jgi:hypothetical protein
MASVNSRIYSSISKRSQTGVCCSTEAKEVHLKAFFSASAIKNMPPDNAYVARIGKSSI